MEFLRFGSSIPGSYWGCCAMDIIQDFKQDPDDKASIQLVSGDGGGPILNSNSEALFAGPTYKDIFLQRIRYGTFSNRDMPNHGFIAILTEWQVQSALGMKWLKILRECGFEFLRSVSNSVYTGSSVASTPHTSAGSKLNHVFVLFRNIGTGGPADPFTPPKEWSSLPVVVDEAWHRITDSKELAKNMFDAHKKSWDAIGPAKFLTEKQVVAAGAPVTLAGLRSEFPQELKNTRDAKKEAKAGKKANPNLKASADPFSVKSAA